MLRLRFAWIPAFVVLLSQLSALAGWNQFQAEWHEFWDRVHVDWHRNNAWPEPFQYGDRQTVRAHFAAQTAKGWQLQTTLGHEYFEPGSQQLNSAGEYHLRWILSQAPEQRRTVFVLRAYDEQATLARVDEVKRAMAATLPRGPMPDVVLSNVPAPSSDAEMLERLWELRKNSVKAPTLPSASSSSTGQ